MLRSRCSAATRWSPLLPGARQIHRLRVVAGVIIHRDLGRSCPYIAGRKRHKEIASRMLQHAGPVHHTDASGRWAAGRIRPPATARGCLVFLKSEFVRPDYLRSR